MVQVNVARLAKLPREILDLAAAKSAAFEDSLTASSAWLSAVSLGKRLLAAAEPDVAPEVAAAEVLAVWERAKGLEL